MPFPDRFTACALVVAERIGAYSLRRFAIFLLLSLAHQAVLIEPQRIFGAAEYATRERDYFGVLIWIHSGVACLILIALGLAACITPEVVGLERLSPALAGVAFAVPWILLLWLIRGAFYARMSPKAQFAERPYIAPFYSLALLPCASSD